MKVKKSHLQIGLILLVAAVLWVVSGYFRSSSPPSSGVQRGSTEPLLASARQPGPERGELDPLSIPEPPAVDMVNAPAWGRDPFLFGSESREMRAVSVRMASADPIVRSILFSTSRRIALIDNRVVGIGDQVGAFKIADIERTAVIFISPTGERRRVGIHGPQSQGLTR